MQIDSQVFFNCETHLHPKNTFIQDGDLSLVSSTQNHVSQQQPAKKPTRQWAAWTRQEEESFFNALRQVGKNFEKITCRVQSKNKDQVRHYYYRLVRRMNKLLGPELCLDAKNSKDTNTAMLRWWSLLEKYSCKASKLHLKPRRFKIFIEALENQLLKDRKKNVKKRASQGENYSPITPSTISNQSRPSGHDTRTVKLVLVDSQNIQRVGPTKGSLKRNVSSGANRSSSKVDSIAMKPARQRRKSGTVSSAAYKKWEKAAIAGVSLVADAAEHLERKDGDKEVEHDQGEKGFDLDRKALPPLPTFSRSLFAESNVLSSMKLKLQLFPIDDATRKALEMDKHNPYLELTLSARKKISSVLEHLNRKWGNSNIASGELMLFPYSIQRENLVGYQRWTQDSIANAADVYATIGSPGVFRLRYGWFSSTEVGSVVSQAAVASCCIPGKHDVNMENGKNQIADSVPICLPPTNEQSNEFVVTHKGQALPVSASNTVCSEMNRHADAGPKNNLLELSDHAANTSWQRQETVDPTITRQTNDADDMRLSNSTALSAGDWADSLTNVSIGELLSEVPDDIEAEANCSETPVIGNFQCLQQIPFSCDSFDAAIAAHISRHQDKIGFQSTLASNASSIWDAEETCDAFAFQKNRVHVPDLTGISSPGSCRKIARTDSVSSCALVEKLHVEDGPIGGPAIEEDPMDECHSDTPALDSSVKDFNALTDMYWPESLGQLDLDMPSSKYHSENLILSDSLGGLNRLIESSLDAFQNCSFFGLDKKENPASGIQLQETASFLQ